MHTNIDQICINYMYAVMGQDYNITLHEGLTNPPHTCITVTTELHLKEIDS